MVPVGGEDPAAVDSITIKDSATGADVTLSVKDGALIVTDPFKESISNVDLGGTTPDPGHLFKVQLDGSGCYTTGTQASQLNNNGLVTLEYINSPGCPLLLKTSTVACLALEPSRFYLER